MPVVYRWIVAACYSAALPFLRGGWDCLRARGGDSFAGALPFAAVAALAAALLWYLAARKRESRIAVYLLLAVLCAAALALFRSSPEPIARIHIAQYAFLGFLVFWAMDGPREGWACCLWAFLAGSALGLADETLQGVLPSRIYDLRDVALNIRSVLLGQAAILFVLRPWERGGDAPPRRGERRRLALPACAFSLAVLLCLLNIALVEMGTPTRAGWEGAVAGGRDGLRHFGPAAFAANMLGIAAAGAMLIAARGPLRGAARALRTVAVCGLLPPLILLAGALLSLRFR